MSEYQCQCYQIGGPFIAEDPDCPIHGNNREYVEIEELREAQQQITELQAERDALQDWKDILIEMTVTSHIYRKEHEDNPRQAIIDLIHWDNHIALDPQVSSAAQALKDKGWNEAIDAAERAIDTGWSEPSCDYEEGMNKQIAINKEAIRQLRREVDDD